MNRSTVETLRECVAELRALREDMEERGQIKPLPRPELQVIEGTDDDDA